MPPKKYYAVKNGKKTGIFNTWNECKAQVDGFKGAIYKSFTNLDDAKNFLSGEEKAITFDDDTAVAYVDGSYNVSTHEYSCGVLLLYKGEKLEFSKKYENEEMADMRNVAGEIMGAVTAMQYCYNNNIKKLVVYHDYQGLSMWANGAWKTNKEGTKNYAEFCAKCREKVEISFVKVKAHSGDVNNDKADELAKKALGIL